MLLKIEEEQGRIRIYRDARILFYALAGMSLPLVVVIPNLGLETSFAVGVIGAEVGAVVLGYLLLRWILHGAIILDKTRNLLTFSKAWDLEDPGFQVRGDLIDSIEIKTLVQSGKHGTRENYKILLGYEADRQSKEKELNLLFTDLEDCRHACRLIGQFTGKPLRDRDGKIV